MVLVQGRKRDRRARVLQDRHHRYGQLPADEKRRSNSAILESRANTMKQRLPFKNQPKIQAKRFKKLRLEKERERVRRTRLRPVKTRSPRRRGLRAV
ncbi:MAG: hypothetical protein OEY77_04145 [Nitrospira sp.]|nr:hypothetical protein [Nitrospira sp.]